jgi:HK97 family phage portal protein
MPGLVARMMQRITGRTETRRDIAPISGFGLGPVMSGSYVNARLAENISAVCACVNAIASTVATLPPRVYRNTPSGRVELPDHPVARLIRRPNDRQTWPDFCEMWLASALLQGNGLSTIEWDGAGRPVRMATIMWNFVLPQLLTTGRLVFDIQNVILPWGGTGVPRRFLEDEVLLLKDRSDDGYLGRSRLARAHEVLEGATGIQEFSAAIWRNAAAPIGALETDAKLTGDVRENLKASWQENFEGPRNARKTVVLEQGLKFNPIAVSPEDAEVLESRRFTVEEICRLYQVPPPIVQDYAHNTFTNSQQAATWFAQLTLTPWVRKIEAEFSRVLFADPDVHLEIDLSGLMRGDYAARWQAAQIAIQNGILTPNEVREAEGYNPRADGDVLRTMPGAAQPGVAPSDGQPPAAGSRQDGIAPELVQ